MVHRFAAVAAAVLVGACGEAVAPPPSIPEPPATTANSIACITDALIGQTKQFVFECAGTPCAAVIMEGSNTERFKFCEGACTKTGCTDYRYVFFSNNVVTDTGR